MNGSSLHIKQTCHINRHRQTYSIVQKISPADSHINDIAMLRLLIISKKLRVNRQALFKHEAGRHTDKICDKSYCLCITLLFVSFYEIVKRQYVKFIYQTLTLAKKKIQDKKPLKTTKNVNQSTLPSMIAASYSMDRCN
nr:hypothetical protein [Pantoea sp. 201603H]